jgi:CRP-like cAMP-binding protein
VTVPRFLHSLDQELRESLVSVGTRRRFPAGATLLAEGDQSDRCLVIEHGMVKIGRLTEEGREVVFGVRGPGDLIGEMALFDGSPRSASVIALEDVSAVQLEAEALLSFLVANSSAALALIKLLAGRLRDADQKLAEFTASDAAGRLARRLVELTEEHSEDVEGGRRIVLPLSQDELAGWTGASREAVAKALAQFRQRGWVTTERRRITVHDVEALRRRGTP